MQEAYDVILAPNPSIMTGPGTNTIVLGGGVEGATVIDPAVDDTAFLDAVIRAGAERGDIRRILITHGHPDHIGGVEALRKHLHVLVYAFSRQGVPFADEEVADGTTFPAGDDSLVALHTPGHRFDHLSFLLQKRHTLFAGDLISGITTNVIAPPDGDMLDYLNSLQRLQEVEIAQIVPAHGPTIMDAQAKISEYIQHRMLREQQVIQALEALSPSVTIAEMVPRIYTDVDPKLHSIATWSVEAHLIKLEREGLVEKLEPDRWALVRPTA
jgi:glyoxylase-like metal-dependent hydrolase (beta-lactamase superfamily II)